MSLARCAQCGEIMSHIEFDQHDCPNSPGDPRDGEPWEDYKRRCEEFKAAREIAERGNK